MINKYIKFIKSLRIEKGLSQLDIAKKLNISRASYIAVEQGKRELTFLEVEKIADFFGITLKDMENGIIPDYEKYKQMILAYLRSDPDLRKGVPKTKLAKLLYLADFAWFYDNLKSMSGMQYRKLQYGPVPDAYFRAIDELFEEGKIEITPTKEGALLISQNRNAEKVKLIALNPKEQKLIKNIADKWKDARTQEIVNFTHNQLPYALCRDNEIIPYELITQEDPKHVF